MYGREIGLEEEVEHIATPYREGEEREVVPPGEEAERRELLRRIAEEEADVPYEEEEEEEKITVWPYVVGGSVAFLGLIGFLYLASK